MAANIGTEAISAADISAVGVSSTKISDVDVSSTNICAVENRAVSSRAMEPEIENPNTVEKPIGCDIVSELVFGECQDLEALCTVMHAAFARYNDDPIPSSALAETVESLTADVAKGWELYQVALGETVVATAKTFPRGERLYFGRLSVLPQVQGKGIAAFLIHGLADAAKAKGFSVLECKVRQSEHKNIEMYQKRGFELVSSEITVSTTGQQIPTVTMHRSLM